MSTPDPGMTLGVDVGGTFTDVVLSDGSHTWRAKAPTTADDLGAGVLAACEAVAGRAGTTLAELFPEVVRFGLGTTAVTNTIASRTGCRVGLLTTRGFEDSLPMARLRRFVLDGWMLPPEPIVARRDIAGIDERIDRDGKVVTPLDLVGVVKAARRLVADHAVEALAISFLWSCRNPQHEETAELAVRRQFPTVPVVAGARLLPVVREYERTTFAVLNAYTSTALRGVEELRDRLRSLGLRVPVLLVHSGGGSTTVDEARATPVALAESGPAAGVAAACAVATRSGLTDAVTCDMGGTSFDVSLVVAGQPTRRQRGELMGVWTALPLIDIESVGAGGGSVGWVDARGLVRVGPRSAGSFPGPACYGRGGREPTVTDALLVLGYLDEERFLGGEMALDHSAALEACAALGTGLGLAADEVAWGIREIALAEMVKAVRERLAGRGLDPRTQAIVSYGGCGGLFTGAIAGEIEAPRVVVPELASVLSAFGAALTDIRRERTRTVSLALPADVRVLQDVATQLGAGIDGDLAADEVAPEHRTITFEADVRFRRQGNDLTIPLRGELDDDGLALVVTDFRAEYARRYGEGALLAQANVEITNLRAVGVGRTVKPSLEPSPRSRAGPLDPVGSRPVLLERTGRRSGVPVFDGAALVPGDTLEGPSLVDGRDTTVWVPPWAQAAVDPSGSLVMTARTR